MEQAKILVVDDNPHNLELLSRILEKHNYEVSCVSSGLIALEVARSGWAELILLDIKMPEMDGYEICQQLKANLKTKDIPIIFLSALDDIADKVKAFQVGAVDYITKPFHAEEILIRVNNQFTIRNTKNAIRLLNEKLEEQVKIRTAELEIANQKLQTEVQQRQQAQDKLLKLALHDPVTGLPNRNSFLSKLKQLLIRYQNQSEYHFAVLLINCNQFSEIKCYFDRLEVNKLLISIANRLQSCLPRSATLSRFEENSFAIALEQITQGEKELIQWVEILQKQFNQTFDLTPTISKNPETQQELIISCHIGIVISSVEYSAAYEILQNAEIATYLAQKANDNYYFFTRNSLTNKTLSGEKIISKATSDLTGIINKLKSHFQEAIKREKICLYYQIVLNLQTSNTLEIQGIEILNDRQDDYRKLLILTDFFQEIEQSQLNTYLNNFIFEQGFFQLKELQQQHETQKNFFLAMQATEEFLLQPQLVFQIKQILTTTQLAAKHLHLDIVANNTILDDRQIFAIIQELDRLGITLNLDCFNLSYENIKNLSDLPFNSFKIDALVIHKITNQNKKQNTLGLIAKIVNLAHANKIKVMAKGIETEEQLTCLQSVGCDYGQGDLFSKPLDKAALETFLVWRL